MIRIAGVNINDKKQARFALTPIKGIGKNNVKQLLAKLGIAPASKLNELSEEQLMRIFSLKLICVVNNNLTSNI
jgi:small subunit ribosomal protein S13